MNSFFQDVRYAIRMLVKSPSFTLVAVLTLALGIGANTAIFSVVNATLLRPLPYTDSDRIVAVYEKRIRENNLTNPVSPADYLDWKAQNQAFSAMAAMVSQSADLIGEGEPVRIGAGQATSEFFDVLGVRPAMGRLFVKEDEQPGREFVVVLTDGLWKERFGGDPGIIGRKINLSGRPHEVIGVLPASFTFWDTSQRLWLPFAFPAEFPHVRAAHFLSVHARLKPGVTQEQAQAQMEAIAGRLEQQYPSPNRGHSVNLVPLREQLVGESQRTLVVLFVAVGFVLLIGCANVANLLLARAATRQRELSIRAALGASRGRLVGQMLTESVLVALGAGAVGLLLALWGVDALKTIVPGGQEGLGPFDFGVDTPVLWFSVALSALTTMFFGLLPALQASRVDLADSLKEGGRGAGGSTARRRLRSALVMAEVALSLVLLIGAGLMIRTFVRLVNVDPGFQAQKLMSFQMVVPRSRYPDNARIAQFFAQLMERLRQQPGVTAAGAISHLPLTGQESRTGIEVEGGSPPANEPVRAHHRIVTEGYFSTMGVPLLEGRFINERDTAEAPPVIMINQTAARRYWPGTSPVGKRLKVLGPGDPPWREVVGVVRDVKHWGLSEDTKPEMYLPMQQTPTPFMNVLVRVSGDPKTQAGVLRDQVWSIDRDLAVSNMRTLEEVIERSVAGRRFTMLLLSLFATLAVVLATVGMYGVMSYVVVQRTHEIGIRMALGAQRQDVLRMVVGEGMKLALIGLTIGLAGALALTRVLEKSLYGVQPTDPATFAAVSLLLAGVALLACWIPARRATRVDPMVALRYE